MRCLDSRRNWKCALRRYGVLIMLVVLGVTMWVGGSKVLAADAPQLAQRPPGTLPPKPTPQPTRVPPTPTPRPRDDGRPSPPAPAPTTVAGEPAPPGSGDAGATVVLTGTINAPTLNVRQGPGTTFPILGRLTSGVTVTVVARTADNAWLRVCCVPASATSGWVSAQFVTPAYTTAQRDALPVGDGATPPPGQPISPSATVTGSVSVVALNVRAAPSTSADILGKLTSGAVVTLLGRNAAGDWWLICCVAGGGNGWVAAQFIAPAAGAAALTALPVTSGLDTPAAAPPLTSASIVTPTAAGDATGSTTLFVAAAPQPAAAVQGEQLLLAFTLTNTGAVAATVAELSFELPAGLKLVSVSATDGGEAVQEDTVRGAPLVIVTWPTLSAGTGATVKIMMMVDADLANGAVLDGAAEALADNAAATFVSVSVGMPPAEPPDFQ